MPEKVNGNKFSGKSNIASLNSNHSPIDSKSAVQLNSTDQKLVTLQKMADNSPYSQRFAHLTSLANNSIPKLPVSQLSKDSQSLPDNVKQGVESLSGISMDDVKVHYNSAKPAQLNAHAYAQGTDIHLASGQEKHLPHEAWHVVQQKQGRVRPTTMMKAKVPINDDQGLEKEADEMGARALQMKPFSLSDFKTRKAVQRKGKIQRNPLETIPEGDEEHDEESGLKLKIKPGLATIPEGDEEDDLDIFQEIAEKTTEETIEIGDLTNNLEDKIDDPEVKKYVENPLAVANRASVEATLAINQVDAAKAATENKKTLKSLLTPLVGKIVLDNKNAKIAASQILAAPAAAPAAAPVAAPVAAPAAAPAAANVAAVPAEAPKSTYQQARLILHTFISNADEYIGEKSTLGTSLDMVSLPGRGIDTYASNTEDKGLAEWSGEGAFVGFMADTTELLSSVGKFYNKEKKPADLLLLGLSVGKFVTGVLDGINTAQSGGLIGEGLSTSISLLPGIKAGLGAFKNGVETYQTFIKQKAVDDLFKKLADSTKSTEEEKEKEKEIIEKYRKDITSKLGEIGLDFILNTAQAIAMIYPPAQVGIASLHVAVKMFQFGRKKYLSYYNNREIKRSERVGDVDVKKLKDEKLGEISKELGFKDAVIMLSNIKDLEEQVKKFPDKQNQLDENNSKLNDKITEINKNKVGNTAITKTNLESFLELEKQAINNIVKEVKKEEEYKKRIFRYYSLPQAKEKIIKIMKDKKLLYQYDDIKLEDIHKLEPAHQDYFFNKTQTAIKEASDRQFISSDERLDKIETLLLTKFDDDTIKDYMIGKYKDQDVYDEAKDTPIDKFKKSVKKFKLEIKLD